MTWLTYEISVEISSFEENIITDFNWYNSSVNAVIIVFFVWNFIDYVIDQQPITSPIVQNIFNLLGGTEYLRSHLWIGGVLIVGVYTLLGISLQDLIAGNSSSPA